MRRLVLALCALASPAATQQTTCQSFGTFTNCQTYPGLTAPSGSSPAGAINSLLNSNHVAENYLQGQAAAQQRRLMQQEIERRQMALDEERRRQQEAAAEPPARSVARTALIQSTARLITQGRCDLAVSSVKETGDAELLSKVVQVCLAASPPK